MNGLSSAVWSRIRYGCTRAQKCHFKSNFAVPVEPAPATPETPSFFFLSLYSFVGIPVEPAPGGRMPAAMEDVELGFGPGCSSYLLWSLGGGGP